MTLTEIAQKIKNKRNLYNMSQAELSKISKIRAATISDIENGKGLTMKTLLSLLAALNLDLSIIEKENTEI